MNLTERVVLAGKVLLGEHTSASVASIAARGIRTPESLSHAEIKTVCASALTQTRDKQKGKTDA
jgi:hypothetical protein